MDTPRLPVIVLRPSRRLVLLLGAAHAGVLLLLPVLPLAPWTQAVLGALLLFSAMDAIRRHALRRGVHSVVALDFSDREQLRVRTREGHWHAGQVLGSSLVSPALVILNLRLESRFLPVHVVIPGDSADAEDLRRLRVWLRWGPRATADAATGG
ncbi:MAG: protein YgfX [Burkholderiales bacterium]